MTYHSSAMGQTMARSARYSTRLFDPHRPWLSPQPEGLASRQATASAIGQLTMDPATLAKLQACTDGCEKQYGVSSGKPDVFSLSMCFGNCNVQYPPSVSVPGGGTITPPAIPSPPGADPVPPLVPGVIEPPPPTPTTPTPKPSAKAGGNTKLWIIGGAVALAAGGAFFYFRKK